jgi:hypothetical protein
MPEDVRLSSTDLFVESGTYVGTVVYAERSELVVEIRDAKPKE